MSDSLESAWKKLTASVGLVVLAVLSLFLTRVQAVNLIGNANQLGGNLKKAGLGSLFGLASNNVGPWKYYRTNSFLFLSEYQSRIGEGMSIPSAVTRGESKKNGTFTPAPRRWPNIFSEQPYRHQ